MTWPVIRENSTRKHTQAGNAGTSPAARWSGLRASTAEGAGSTPGRGTEIPHAQKKGKKTKQRWQMPSQLQFYSGKIKRGESQEKKSKDAALQCKKLKAKFLQKCVPNLRHFYSWKRYSDF